AKLYRILRCLEDSADSGAVDALALESAVQVDDVQPLEALVFESAGLVGGVFIVDGSGVHIAELQANALAVLEVDSWEKDHL
ncbi:hypothetical protein, partial [Klebsiella pneumoniae]|uniref:hypothetical protein n=1 Tax=Klebsiella pneumoniae TaxID=573 RepID=UPI00222EDC95